MRRTLEDGVVSIHWTDLFLGVGVVREGLGQERWVFFGFALSTKSLGRVCVGGLGHKGIRLDIKQLLTPF